MSDRNKPDNPMGNGIAIGISPGVVCAFACFATV